jgi:dephospho-CoA kinase
MYVVGIIGEIGSGKSTVCSSLAAMGAQVVSADAIAAEVRERSEVIEALCAAFGADIRTPEGGIDRVLLAQRAFDTSEHTDLLDQIMVSSICDEIAVRIASCASRPGLLLVELPLAGSCHVLDGLLDETLHITASDETRLARLVARGMDPTDARRRMGRQRATASGNALPEAETVIENEDTAERLHEQLEAWLAERKTLCAM